MRLHERLAREMGVSPSKLLRDAAFAYGVDRLGEVFGPAFRARIMTKQCGLNMSDISLLGRLPAAELARIGESGLKARAAEMKQAKAAPKKLGESQRAYLRLNAEDRRAFRVWLVQLDGEDGFSQ